MPVHFRQIASQCSGQYQGDIGYGRTVTELFRTVSSHKITGYQSGGKRNNQPGPIPNMALMAISCHILLESR